MWQAQKNQVDAHTIRYQLQQKQQILTFENVLDLWQYTADFRLFYNQLLANTPYVAFFWEHPSMSKATLDRPYEFVLIDSPSLAEVSAEPQAFANHFGKYQTVASFTNLGGDAQLVAPQPLEGYDYPHLAKFCRNAPEKQVHEFWAKAGEVTNSYLSAEKRWLSTSGLGVYWLHLRLDNRPKYYNYRAYR